jgi:SAM-dependent methyltransferase
MPIQIDPARAQDLAPQFDEALDLVRNEFEGLDIHRQYRNAFARLLKRDPLGRVLMMGTDQRDMFVPELRCAVEASVPSDGHIFDFGAGDGQTFALVAASVPKGTRVSIEEPDPEYLANYSAFLKTQAHLRLGVALAAGFDEIDAAAARSGETLPQDGSVDLGLALHMIYFVDDLPSSITRMVRFLSPGGALFVVVTDETIGYTGLVLNRFIQEGGDTGDNARHLSVITERRRLLGSPADGGGAISEILRAAGVPAEIEVQRQPSRLYGHNLADLIALSSIAVLAGVEGLAKFEAAAALLRHEPEVTDLRIEDDGPRKGMWSVTQPQWVALFRRAGSKPGSRS